MVTAFRARAGRVGLVPVDLTGGGAGNDSGRLPVDLEPEAVVPGGDGDDLARVDQADLDLLGSDHDAAREETRRCTVTGPDGGSGLAAARRAPRSRYRSLGGTGQGMVRASSPSLVMTAIWVPSIRRVPAARPAGSRR